MMTTVITWKYIFSMRAKTWSCEKLLWIGTCCKGVRREGVEGILTDKINYAMLDLAVVIPFSIGFIRILIRFCIHSSSCFLAAKDSTSCRLSRLKGFFSSSCSLLWPYTKKHSEGGPSTDVDWKKRANSQISWALASQPESAQWIKGQAAF